MLKLNYVLLCFATLLQASVTATVQTAAAPTVTQAVDTPTQCPSTSGSGVIRILSGDPHAGLYISTATANNGVLLTTQVLGDAMHVSLTPGIDPTPIRILNPAKNGYGFLGLASNKAAAVFGPKSTDYTGLTYISNPGVKPVTSLYAAGKTVVKGLWSVGINGQLEFDWDHTDGSVYKLTQSVQMNPARVYQTSNLDTYINTYFPNNSSGHAEVTLVYEPITQ